MDLSRDSSAKLRDKRNRVLERESNELKDELCAMKHIVHLLDNIKRVSTDCINFLHLMVDAAIRTDSTQLDQLRDDVQELEEELKTWERKYQMMSSMRTIPAAAAKEHNYTMATAAAIKAIVNKTHALHQMNANNDTTTDDNEPTGGGDSMEGQFEGSTNGHYYEDSDRADDGAHSSSHNSMVLMPQELCEMSMETGDNEHVVITSADTSPQPHTQSIDGGSPLDGMDGGLQDMSAGKTLFECEWIGCNFKTNMRQRLVMHKRLHAGESLFSCDVPGCGYQSNYKGNIKIHKKHKHRIDSDDNKEYSTPHVSLNTSSHLTPNLSHHLTKNNNNLSPNMIRRRKRKKKFRFTSSRMAGIRSSPVSGGQLVVRDGANAGTDDVDDESVKGEQSALFSCNIKGCNYRSKWKQCLTAHQLLHAGVKPFKCDHPGCNYRTNFKGNVNVHKRVHRESQYQCQVNGCQFSTPWKNSFNQHQRNHMLNSNTETELNIDNHIEMFDEQNSDENDFYDGLDDEVEPYDDSMDGQSMSDQLEEQLAVAANRKVLQTVIPVTPVQRIQNSGTNDLIATQHNSEFKPIQAIQTNAQPLVPPLVGVIKTIKTEI